MGKIVKYCTVCDEGFAEKFSFCPNCASQLTAYEMSPVKTEPSEIFDPSEITEPALDSASETTLTVTADVSKTLENTFDSESWPVLTEDDSLNLPDQPLHPKNYDDGIYHVALVENTNNSVRNSLLLGAFLLVMVGTFAGVIISIFTTSLNIGAIDDNSVIVRLPVQDADFLEEERKELAKQKDAGGRGGNNDPNPASRGRDARTMEDPMVNPSVKLDSLTNPDIKLRVGVKGRETEYNEDKTQPYGLKNSPYTIPSDGPGGPGGQGPGGPGGQGTGPGRGIGPGGEDGVGGKPIATKRDDDDTEPPPEVRKVTTALNITSKPKAIYTDSARQNMVQGTVILRVTFLSNGTIGSITPISGLPNGLTEQAIAAARNMKFEPQKVNGVAQTITRQVQYTFTLF